MSQNFRYVSLEEIRRIRYEVEGSPNAYVRCEILSNINRINALYMIMRARGGHIGSSFSAMDIVTWLWEDVMKNPNKPNGDISDIYFSSKGHDVPGLYALLISQEKIPFEYLHRLRRLDGLPGHPNLKTPYIVANTGSLGMGISKAKGMIRGSRILKKYGRVYVLLGDGELQEGQLWESLQQAANQKLHELIAIVDHNTMQSDTFVSDVNDLGNIKAKFSAFGWDVLECDGHNFLSIDTAFSQLRNVFSERPKVIIANTVKGRGVGFMESTHALRGELYKFHSGAPTMEDYSRACDELIERVSNRLSDLGFGPLVTASEAIPKKISSQDHEQLVAVYAKELVRIGESRRDILVLDADLVKDCGLVPFRNKFPQRFIECGIAEQDMVSTAGGIASRGLLPIVNSFAQFLSNRPNEQIYNNATEGKKIIYVGSLAGLLPATPGHSHQAVRDIAALRGIPGLTLIQPSCAAELAMALKWAAEENTAQTYIRLSNIPISNPCRLPQDYKMKKGCGVFLGVGSDVAIIAYGPVMLREAKAAAKTLLERGISTAVVNLPWLNTVDKNWLSRNLFGGRVVYKTIVTIDDHYIDGGQGMMLLSAFAEIFSSGQVTFFPKILSFGVSEIPVCGEPAEVLKYHGLDADSIVEKIEKSL